MTQNQNTDKLANDLVMAIKAARSINGFTLKSDLGDRIADMVEDYKNGVMPEVQEVKFLNFSVRNLLFKFFTNSIERFERAINSKADRFDEDLTDRLKSKWKQYANTVKLNPELLIICAEAYNEMLSEITNAETTQQQRDDHRQELKQRNWQNERDGKKIKRQEKYERKLARRQNVQTAPMFTEASLAGFAEL